MKVVTSNGDIPQPRFGHTCLASYTNIVSNNLIVVFGGATGDIGKYSITNETYIYETNEQLWTKLDFQNFDNASNSIPSPRAAHAACIIDKFQMIVFGGASGGGSLTSDELYLLDLRKGFAEAQWLIVPVLGQTPGRRYGHTLIFSKPFLIVFGGNTGTEPVNDTWVLDVEKQTFVWNKLSFQGPIPTKRVYHSGSLCTTGSATGMIVIFGGRGQDQLPLNDIWGLRKHRNGDWDWVQAPCKANTQLPVSRFQHTSVFYETLLLIIGGRTNRISDEVHFDIYDTETSEWTTLTSTKRFRHSSCIQGKDLYIFGGFNHDSTTVPTNKMTILDFPNLLKQNNITHKINPSKLSDSFSPVPAKDKEPTSTNPIQIPLKKDVLKNGGKKIDEMKKKNEISKKAIQANHKESTQTTIIEETIQESQQAKGDISIANNFIKYLLRPSEWSATTDGNGRFKFSTEEIVSLAEECHRIIKSQPMILQIRVPLKVFGDIHGQYQDLMRFFDLWGGPSDEGDIGCFDYLFLGDYVDRGAHSLETICLLMALKIKYPDQIHLLRGNHEDKWINVAFGFADECSTRLEEDVNDKNSAFAKINELFDWLPLAAIIEKKVLCLHGGIGSMLKDVEQIRQIPRPLEVVHEVSNGEQQLVVDILWSDPSDNDNEKGIMPNIVRDPNSTGNIVKFGPDKVHEFLNNNNMTLILRAHECVMDGFERFAEGSLITVFSATDYCGRHKNAGSVLFISKSLEITPKLIYPLNNSNENWITNEESLKLRPPTPPRWSTIQNKNNSFS